MSPTVAYIYHNLTSNLAHRANKHKTGRKKRKRSTVETGAEVVSIKQLKQNTYRINPLEIIRETNRERGSTAVCTLLKMLFILLGVVLGLTGEIMHIDRKKLHLLL